MPNGQMLGYAAGNSRQPKNRSENRPAQSALGSAVCQGGCLNVFPPLADPHR